MTDATLNPPRMLSKRIRLIWLFLVMLSVVWISSAAQVRQCEVVTGAFSSHFSSDFDVQREMCRDTTPAHIVFDRLQVFVALVHGR